MYTDVYADVLFLINFSMDAIALYVSAKLCAMRARASKIAIAATVGAIYSVVGVFLSLNIYIELFIFVLVCIIMTCIALDPESVKSCVRCSFVMFVSSAMLGGVMTALYSVINNARAHSEKVNEEGGGLHPLLFAFLAIVSMALALFLTRLHGSGNLPQSAEVTVTVLDKHVGARGIFDSGNMLKDPLTNKSVIVMSSELFLGVLSDEFLHGAETGDMSCIYRITNEEKKRFRLIHAKGVGKSTYLYAVTADKIEIRYEKNGKLHTAIRDAVVALSGSDTLSQDVKCVIPTSVI